MTALILAAAPVYAQPQGQAARAQHGDGDRDRKGDDKDKDKGNSRRVRIAWLANDPANTYDGAALDGASEVAEDNHSTVEAFYAGFDPEVQLEQCRDVVRGGRHDAIAILPADSNAIVPCVTEAERKHIPVVAIDLPIGPDVSTVEPQVPGQVGAVLVPAADWGAALASLVVDVCTGEAACDVGYIAGAFTVAFDAVALRDLDATAAANPHIRIVDRQEAFYTRELARQAALVMLDEHPGIRVMIGAGDQMAQGIEDALAERPPEQPIKIIVGAGAGEYGVSAVREGRWYATFVALPRDEGLLGADIAIRAARRQPIAEPGINPVARRGWPAFFTAENQDEFVGFEPQWR